MKRGIVLILALVILAGGVIYYTKSKGRIEDTGKYPVSYLEYKNNPDWKGGETNPILASIYFNGEVREAYESAAAIPEVLDHLYCYCYCAQHHGHKSLRTCFTDGHGSGCDICINEARLAKQLHDKGYSIKEIRNSIDREFYQPYESHDSM